MDPELNELRLQYGIELIDHGNEPEGDCEFGPCADCFRENCPERVEELRTYPRITRAERSALLAILDDELEG